MKKKASNKISVSNNVNMLNNIMRETETKKKMMCGGPVKLKKR